VRSSVTAEPPRSAFGNMLQRKDRERLKTQHELSLAPENPLHPGASRRCPAVTELPRALPASVHEAMRPPSRRSPYWREAA
jgi:hypothetical protein